MTAPIKSSFPKAPKPPLAWDQLQPLVKAAWERGILVVRLEDLKDDWERQFATNIGNRIINGERQA